MTPEQVDRLIARSAEMAIALGRVSSVFYVDVDPPDTFLERIMQAVTERGGRVDALIAENANLKLQAERYLAVREMDPGTLEGIVWDANSPEEFDAAIDARRACNPKDSA